MAKHNKTPEDWMEVIGTAYDGWYVPAYFENHPDTLKFVAADGSVTEKTYDNYTYYVRCEKHDRVMEVPRFRMTRSKRVHLCEACQLDQQFEVSARRGPNPIKSPYAFFDEARFLHDNRYTYPTESFDKNLGYNVGTRIRAVCPDHGEFATMTDRHIHVGDPLGCPVCRETEFGIKYRVREYQAGIPVKVLLDRFEKAHGDHYTYDITKITEDYRCYASEVRITCPTHGEFYQSATRHWNGVGCQRCSQLQRATKASQNWLDEIGIPITQREVPSLVEGRRFFADGYCPESNTVFEFLGDYYHGNPAKYEADKEHKAWKTTFGELYNKTVERRNEFLMSGYTVVEIWGSEYENGLPATTYHPTDVISSKNA